MSKLKYAFRERIVIIMKITETTTAQDVWDYYLTQKRKVFDPLATSFRITVQEAKEARAEADRLGYALKSAEARIKELEREVDKLQHYRDVVEQALADAG